MDKFLYIIPAMPLVGFLVLSMAGRHLSKTIALIGAGTISASALLTIILGLQFLQSPPAGNAYVQTLWEWIRTQTFSCSISFRLDALSLVFVFVITFVGALIHIYSTAFMRHDRDYARFFASMNLFVFAMLILVMADNLLFLYLGWEGVGLCSYLLIGFWYETPANNRAANKAFYITRIGDTAMAIGLFLLFKELGTLNIPEILNGSSQHFTTGSSNITAIALLLLLGGMGKSAQLPFQTWLPDAMAGPSPVSALIHAATMVTAGVYLVARMHTLFELSPIAMHVTAVVGALTLFVAGCSAMVQSDIKRILAYSTISQIGYMFLALGVGAWSAAIFHFFTHAFFKALLFLAAGAVIESLHHEHNIFKMGGLKDKMPVIFWTFLAGSAALAALPFISAGFYSKDLILWYSWSADNGNPLLWIVALLGAFITAFYTARLMIVVFWGEMKTHIGEYPGKLMTLPLIILAVLSVVAGFIEWPHNITHLTLFSDLVHKVLPVTAVNENVPAEVIFQLTAIAVTLSGVYAGYVLYYKNRTMIEQWQQSPDHIGLYDFFYKGWGFDQLYGFLFVRPFVFITQINKSDFIDRLYKGIAFWQPAVKSNVLSLAKWFFTMVCSRSPFWNSIHLNLTIVIMILAIMISILMAGGLLSWLVGQWNNVLAKWIALLAVLIDFAITANLWMQHSGASLSRSNTWFINYRANWIPAFGITFHLALDGLSIVLLLLTFFLGTLAVLCSWNEIKQRVGFYYFNLLWTLAGISGVFIALDLFLFYFFWEVMLVPMFFLIGIWGDSNRRYAAYKFFIFTQVGGLLMLISILALYFIHGAQTGIYSYDYFDLLKTRLDSSGGVIIMLGFLIAFCIKLPMIPFHNWLPDAHSEAPTAGSLILAGLLLKTGAYGIIRFVLPLFPEAAAAIAWWAMLFGVIGIVYGAMLAFAQTDIKRLIAYTSVSHMGFVLLGIFAFREMAMQGVVMQMITHGISTGALFVMAGMIKERLHTRDIGQMGGLWTSMPAMGGVALLFTMASLGLPLLGNFIAEFLILMGTFDVNVPLTVFATLGLVFSALYSLRMMQKVFLGPTVADHPLKDFSTREMIIMAVLTISIVLLGLFPQPVIDMAKTVVNDVLVKR